MGRGVLLAALIMGMIPAAGSFAQVLQMGTDGVAWELNNDTGPLLYREVPEAQFVSVRAKISAQTAGFWSQAGVIAGYRTRSTPHLHRRIGRRHGASVLRRKVPLYTRRTW